MPAFGGKADIVIDGIANALQQYGGRDRGTLCV